MSRREAEKAELASRGERVVNPEELLGRASGLPSFFLSPNWIGMLRTKIGRFAGVERSAS